MVFNMTAGQTFWFGVLMVLGFITYKYLILPRSNEGLPIDPPESEEWY